MQENRLFRVGIIDSDEEYTERIINAFDCVPFVEIVFVMHTGNEVLQEIVRNYPDLIILNDVLPYNDGIEILRSIEESGIRKPYIIFTSNIQSNVFINRAVVLGINEYMLKPYRAESLVRRVRMVYRSMTGEDEIFHRSQHDRWFGKSVGQLSDVVHRQKWKGVRQTPLEQFPLRLHETQRREI